MNNNHFAQFIKETRSLLGITQTNLAQSSGLSLPTVQNIEAGRGNPSLSTMQEIVQALNMQVQIKPVPTDWDSLAACGAPLMQSKKTKIKPDANLLVKNLKCACLELDREPSNTEGCQRKLEAVSALLWALKLHYPDFYARHFHSAFLEGFQPKNPSGRLIKLKRQALANVSSYL